MGSMIMKVARIGVDGRSDHLCKKRTNGKNDLHSHDFPNISFYLNQIEIHKMASTDTCSGRSRTKDTYTRNMHAFWSTDQALNQSKQSSPVRLTFLPTGQWFMIFVVC